LLKCTIVFISGGSLKLIASTELIQIEYHISIAQIYWLAYALLNRANLGQKLLGQNDSTHAAQPSCDSKW